MSLDSNEMIKAKQAQEKLIQEIIHHENVSLIDIGLDPVPTGEQQLVIRVHLRKPSAGKTLTIPSEVDGIPVRIITGDYRPES